MNNELNINAVELSNDELDTVAGGFSSDAFNDFFQKNLNVGQQTFAGPNGSGTFSSTSVREVFSNASQGIAVK